MMPLCTTSTALALVSLLAAGADGRRRFEPADIVSLARVSDPQISPDGRHVAYVVSRPNQAGRAEPRVWLVPAEGGDEHELTTPGPALAPRWSPDGRRLAVILPGKESKIVVRGVADDSAEVVFTSPTPVRDLRWSPDGAGLAFLQVDPPTPEDVRNQSQGRDAEVVGENLKHTRLYLLDLKGRATRPLTPEDQTVWRFGWSQDGRQIALLASAEPTAEGQEYRSELAVVDVRSGTRKRLVTATNPHAAPAFSADGRRVVYLGPQGRFLERGVVKVVSVDTGDVVERLADHPGNVWDVTWRPGTDSLLAAVAEGTVHHLIQVAPDGGWRRLARTSHSITPYWDPNLTLSADGRRAAFLGEGPDHAEEVHVADLDAGTQRRLTRVHAGLAASALGAVETVEWTNPRDGSRVHGVLVRPPGVAAGTRLPAVTVLHGGPAYNWGMGVQVRSWAQLFASRGYLVFLPNFRGSSGSGMGWLTANVRDWGEGPLSDVLAGVDHLVARGWADPERLFVGGGSYGGYLTSWTVTHTDRFRAAWVAAGVSNVATEYALTDEPTFLVGYFGTTPYDDFELYRAASPVTHAARARTPTLIVHGERDIRVPVAQAYELFAALRHYGVKARLVVYPREGHGVREPAHQLDYMDRVLGWLEAHGGLPR